MKGENKPNKLPNYIFKFFFLLYSYLLLDRFLILYFS